MPQELTQSLTEVITRNIACGVKAALCVGLTILTPSISIVNQPDAPMYQIILFWNDTLRVSDGLSFHHQEIKTVHTATAICQTDTTVCLQFDKCLLLYVQS